MPKKVEFPRLRKYVRKGKSGQTWTSYAYDMSGLGGKSIPLGTNYEEAVRLWRLIQAGKAVDVMKPPKRVPVAPAVAAKRPRRLAPLAEGKRRKFEDGTWAGLPDWAKPMYLNAERRSKASKRLAFIGVREFADVVKRANSRCEVTGIPFEQSPLAGGKFGPFAPSIDRIDSSKGYVAGNIRIVCLLVNLAMNKWGIDPLRVVAQHLLEATSIDTGSNQLPLIAPSTGSLDGKG